MNASMPSLATISAMVDAGSTALDSYTIISSELARRKSPRSTPRAGSAPGALADVPPPDGEAKVQFKMNQTGNIFYATTSETVGQDTKDLFNTVTVLFAAMTKALADKKKDLFDYDSWSAIIAKSGFFTEVQKFEQTLSIQSTTVTIDTQVIQQLLPSLQSGSSLEIAKGVLNAMNGKFSAEGTTDTTKLGHLLFICEEIFGAPSVTIRLFFATKASHKVLTSSPCHTSASNSFEQKQEANTFLFVSPENIVKFAGSLSTAGENPEYKALIAKLGSYLA